MEEVVYKDTEKENAIRYGVGFKNIGGGYSIRNPLLKTQLAPQTFTHIKGIQNDSSKVHVFEGFLDFATVLESVGRTQPTYDTIVLNSLNNTKAAISHIKAEKVDMKDVELYLWFDNEEQGSGADKAVNKALWLFADTGATCMDARGIYRGYKDPNEKWVREGGKPFHFAFTALELPMHGVPEVIPDYKKPLPLFEGLNP